MKKLTVGVLTGLVSMMTLVSAAGAQPPEASIPPPMTVEISYGACFNVNTGAETAERPNGNCNKKSERSVTTTVFNPAGHAPRGLNK